MSEFDYLDLDDVRFSTRAPAWGPRCARRDVPAASALAKFVCILMAAGCGKTTVLNLIAGFELPRTGAPFLLNGADRGRPGMEARHRSSRETTPLYH